MADSGSVPEGNEANMKRCPQCNRTYTDDALSFCLDDGSPLAAVTEQPPMDTAPTVQYPPPRETSQPTIAYRPGQMPPAPPSWSPVPPPQPQKRSVWPWLLGIGAIVVLMGIGLVVLIFVVARISSRNSNDRANINSNNSNLHSNRNSNSNLANTNSNSNSRSSASFTDDFSTKSWST